MEEKTGSLHGDIFIDTGTPNIYILLNCYSSLGILQTRGPTSYEIMLAEQTYIQSAQPKKHLTHNAEHTSYFRAS